jgi:hypothetical protein
MRGAWRHALSATNSTVANSFFFSNGQALKKKRRFKKPAWSEGYSLPAAETLWLQVTHTLISPVLLVDGDLVERRGSILRLTVKEQES